MVDVDEGVVVIDAVVVAAEVVVITVVGDADVGFVHAVDTELHEKEQVVLNIPHVPLHCMSQLFPAHPRAHFVATSPQQNPNCLDNKTLRKLR